MTWWKYIDEIREFDKNDAGSSCAHKEKIEEKRKKWQWFDGTH